MISFLVDLLCYTLCVILSGCLFLWLWNELTMGICRNKDKSLNGKTVLITGGNSGLGFETAVELARRGARLIIGCRNTKNVENRIRLLSPMVESVDVVRLDLTSFDSIRKFSEEIKSRYDQIHILINNAGILKSDQTSTENGFEMTIGTNYLGHALLNKLLLDLVKRAGEVDNDYSRIILVSSIAATNKKVASDLCRLDSGNTSYRIDFSGNNPIEQYSKSKLCQIMYGKHLAKVLKEDECKTVVVSLHPGIVRTNIWETVKKPMIRRIVQFWNYLIGKTPLQGAQTAIHLSLCDFSESPKDVSGTFFSDCRSRHWINHFLPKIVQDPSACKALWDETMKALDTVIS